jgi:hypothetical protein
MVSLPVMLFQTVDQPEFLKIGKVSISYFPCKHLTNIIKSHEGRQCAVSALSTFFAGAVFVEVSG